MKIAYGEFFTRPVLRGKVERLEKTMQGLPQIDCPVRHYFAPGIYAREITIPQGTVLVGAIHKTENLAILSKGRLLLATKSGPLEISSPHMLTVKPGDKNSATALEDSVWTNFFPTEETDQEKLVTLLTESTAQELLGGKQNVQLMAHQAKELEI